MDEAKPEDAVLAQTAVMARLPMPHLPGAARKITWDEVNTGFSEEQAVAEAKRCLNCAICSECMECVRACGPGALLHGERDAEMRRRRRRRRHGHGLRPLRPRRQERVRLQALPQRALGARVRAHAQRQRPHHRRGQAPQRRRAPQEDRLHPVRRLARPGARVLLQRLLHVRQQAGDAHHRPRARLRAHRLPHGHARPGQGLRRLLPARPGQGRQVRPLAPLVHQGRPAHRTTC